MQKAIVWMVFSALLLLPVAAQADTLQPSMSISLMSKNNELLSSMRFGLNYDHILNMPRLGNGDLVLSVGVYMDLENELLAMTEGDMPNLNGFGGKLSLNWQRPVRANFGAGMTEGIVSIGASLETLVDANGQRHFMLSVQPMGMNFNMNFGGQDINIMSSMNLQMGLTPSLSTNDLATINRIQNSYRVK